ncbi:MAG: NAD(P)/FAD-dependent oxidoreductase [Dehalococcoidia bacterium]|nr:NAD(P)/FAD-dependent oxidoreductase [Dehalococcoidia bacterium]MDW8008179.1 NAD(P)/FAD-dependent oxidoreductase [Chloroflexota bacterium]
MAPPDLAPDVDVAVVGAGVVGLAVAATLAPRCRVALLERHHTYGLENSSHNSGVIHAGLYFPPDWLKTRLCVEGNRLLYAWAEAHGVRHRRLGKLVIARREEELPALEALLQQGRRNGAPGLEMLTPAEVARLEPHLRCAGAFFSPSSGIVDQMGLMRSLLQEAQAHGALVAFRHEVIGLTRADGGFRILYRGPDGDEGELAAARVVNAAGLHADRVGALLGYDPDGGPHNPPFRHCFNRGRYYDLVDREKASRLRHLIYPLPNSDRTGAGIHVGIDLDGNVHLGPDTEWLPEGAPLDFRNDDTARERFLEAGRAFYPDLRPEDLAPGQVGYRPKLQRPGGPPQDFLIWHDRGYVHLGGIESPGLTSCLAIARHVAGLLGLG